MPTLKRYVARQCEDAVFRGLYAGFCEVCAVTVEAAARILALGLSNEEAAARFSVTVREMTELLEADHCSPAVVVKICAGLGITPPAACRKKDEHKKPPGGGRREGD